ncbi:MAG TPA: hypothetical protein VLS94_08770 [Fusibacter sp.]|nr:hypothetical protein [Fusibacter sp.]
MDGTTAIKIDYYEELKRKADFVDKMISPSANEIYKEFEELKAKADKYDKIKGLFENTLFEIEKELDKVGEVTEKTADRFKSLFSYKSIIIQAMNLIEGNAL